MNYATLEKQGEFAIVWLDQEGEKVNKVSPELIQAFDGIFSQIDADSSIKAVILASKKKDFIAGADIEMFQKVTKKGDFEPITRRGHASLSKLEKSKKPIIAAIHGSCMGAGLEIALACHGRVVADEGTVLALPEIKLGLLPGGGGTQRLPRLIGIQKALDIMLTGKNVYGKQAYKMGLADRVTNKAQLVEAAKYLAKDILSGKFERKRKITALEWALEGNPLGRSVLFKKAKEMTLRQTRGNYPAAERILECVEIGMNQGIEKGYDAEAIKFEELILTNVSRQLINIFFAMTEMKKNPWKELVRPVRTLGMLGAGFMGAGIAEVSAAKGVNVLLKDLKEEAVAKGKKTIWDNYAKKVKRKAMTLPEAEAVINRVSGTTTYDNFDKVDVIIEAVLEDLDLKKKVVKEVEDMVRPDCIFASNTSALPIKAIAEASQRPELVIGMHYFSPVPKMPLLEIIVTDKTADWVTATCLDLGIKQGKTCIVVKDGPGFYTTRILSPFLNEALLLLEEGADALQLDEVMKDYGFPVGPITLMDEVGIDVGAHIYKGKMTQEFIQSRQGAKITDAMVRMYEGGFHGRKNKKGFYVYDEKGKKVRGKINSEAYRFFGGENRKKMDKTEIQQRMGMIMMNEAAMCLQEGILLSARDGDIGAVFGLGFPPFSGGPFRMMDFLGLKNVEGIMKELSSKHGARFTPAPIISELAKDSKTFHIS
ncbi:MAG: enoyl-CoA hydratase/isomerase family protein [Bacteroidia bacterium]|nr:enoyl-CoA hydratase/isomerase family protein [Bacteroidia bacterium]